MTGAETLSYIKTVFKRTDKDSEIYTAIADTVMDMRARMLSDDYSYVATTPSGTLAVGDYKLAVPSDLGHIIGDISIRDSETDTVYDPLTRITKKEYDDIYRDVMCDTVANRLTGVPRQFCYYGKEVYLGPAVDKTTYVFTMNYTMEDTPTITSSTDPVQFTDKFREVIKAGVLYRMYRDLELDVEKERWRVEYEQGIQKIIDNDTFNSGVSELGIQYNGF